MDIKNIKLKIKIILILSFFFTNNAFAYFDPGSGSYLIQLFIAFIASCYFFITNPIKFIKSFFNKKKDKNENEKTENKPKD
tara:strand:+ start:281 stop:523 length:243 start_codon:yes stop_codon:yes gene_type:complete